MIEFGAGVRSLTALPFSGGDAKFSVSIYSR